MHQDHQQSITNTRTVITTAAAKRSISLTKHRKLLIMGLPGAGKTALARVLAKRLNAVHFNADDIRAHITPGCGFSLADRIPHARRMGWLCDRVVEAGGYAIADFVCPTPETRAAFFEGGPSFVVFVDRIEKSRFADTNAMFSRPIPAAIDVLVTTQGPPELWADLIAAQVLPVFDPKAPTALFVGRFQPFHHGHRALVAEGIRRLGQACIAIRDTGGTDASNPYGFEEVRSRVEHSLRDFAGRFTVVSLPNIKGVFYGRDVGYSVERIEVDQATAAVSATREREKLKRDVLREERTATALGSAI